MSCSRGSRSRLTSGASDVPPSRPGPGAGTCSAGTPRGHEASTLAYTRNPWWPTSVGTFGHIVTFRAVRWCVQDNSEGRRWQGGLGVGLTRWCDGTGWRGRNPSRAAGAYETAPLVGSVCGLFRSVTAVGLAGGHAPASRQGTARGEVVSWFRLDWPDGNPVAHGAAGSGEGAGEVMRAPLRRPDWDEGVGDKTSILAGRSERTPGAHGGAPGSGLVARGGD